MNAKALEDADEMFRSQIRCTDGKTIFHHIYNFFCVALRPQKTNLQIKERYREKVEDLDKITRAAESAVRE